MATKKISGAVTVDEGQPVTDAEQDVRSLVIEDRPETGLVVPPQAEQHNVMSLDGVRGAVDASDLRLPDLQIAYGVGKLAENFSPGDLVLGGDVLLVGKNTPITVIVLGAHVYYKQWLSNDDYAAGITAREFATAEEVRAAGLTLEWTGDRTNRVAPGASKAANMSLLVQKPEKVENGLFSIQVGDTRWAPARMRVDKMAYASMVPDILSLQGLALRERGLRSGRFNMYVTVETAKGKTKVLPHVRLVGHLSNQELDQINAVFGRSSAG